MMREILPTGRFRFSGIHVLMAFVLCGIMAASPAVGAIMTSFTSTGATTADGPVTAKATFTTTANKITVVLENLIIDQRSVGQNISGLFFTLSTGQTAGTLAQSSGLLRNIASNGTYTDQGLNSTGWQLSTSGSQLHLNVLGTPAGPTHTIVGAPNSSNIYKKANNSIMGNDPHNPFISESATFEINIMGVTSASRINNISFVFGTTPYTLLGTTPPPDPIEVPEPATLALLSLGGLVFLRPRKTAR
jgi:hypothetical protein